MLVLTRGEDEAIVMGDVIVRVVEIQDQMVRLAIASPQSRLAYANDCFMSGSDDAFHFPGPIGTDVEDLRVRVELAAEVAAREPLTHGDDRRSLLPSWQASIAIGSLALSPVVVRRWGAEPDRGPAAVDQGPAQGGVATPRANARSRVRWRGDRGTRRWSWPGTPPK